MKETFDRAKLKTKEQEFINKVRDEFDLPPIMARGLLKLVQETFSMGDKSLHDIGKMRILAIAKEEPPNEPIFECKLISVTVTLHTKEDIEVYEKHGMAAYRQTVINRITEEAFDQGGLLTQEDLVFVLKCSPRTIRRDIKALRDRGVYVPCRGQVKDMGKGVSHKTQIVEMYLKGYEETQIGQFMKHSLTSIAIYIKDFTRVVLLKREDFKTEEIRSVTNLSERLVKEYLDLYKKSNKKEYRDRLDFITNLNTAIQKKGTRRGN